MAFGPIMQLAVGGLQIELAPIAKDDMRAFVSPGMQQGSITRYFARSSAPVLEDEHEWYEKTRTDKTSIVWGIWVIDGENRRLIGTTALNELEGEHIRQATSGVLIFDKDYWGKGIASHIHKARTWYAFKHLGLTRIKSGVVQGNEGSRIALERSGYTLVYVERNFKFVEGRMRHVDCLECLNPEEWAWKQWWEGDRPTKQSRDARVRTRQAMDWAEENVTLP